MTGEAPTTAHSHVVNFYDDESQVTSEISRFVAEGLKHGERVVVIATAAHRTVMDEVLLQFGTDAARARASGRLVTLDAEGTLATFMVDGVPHLGRFETHVRALVEAAAEDGCVVRVFGEMVAVLWQQGNVAGAIELETLWNTLTEQRPFSLMCAYPTTALDIGELAEANEVCALHSSVIPPRSYVRVSSVADSDGPVERTSQVFLPVVSAVPAARRFVADVLRSWGQQSNLVDASVVVSELATNAVLHAASAFRVHLTHQDGVIRISVDDVGPARPEPRQAAPEDFGGRGMQLVKALTLGWGYDTLDTGKTVWADIATRR